MVFLYFFLRGILPLLFWGAIVTGIYAYLLNSAGQTAALTSMIIVFPIGIFGLWKTCEAVM